MDNFIVSSTLTDKTLPFSSNYLLPMDTDIPVPPNSIPTHNYLSIFLEFFVYKIFRPTAKVAAIPENNAIYCIDLFLFIKYYYNYY